MSKKIHHGKIVESRVRQSGISITDFAEKMKMSRRWVYQTFEKPRLSKHLILDIGDVIGHDFSLDFDFIDRLYTKEELMYILQLTWRKAYQRDISLKQHLKLIKDKL